MDYSSWGHKESDMMFTWETQPCCKKSFCRWPVKAVTSVPPGYPQRKLQGSLFSGGLIDVTWVEVGMGRKRYFWRCSSLWEGFYLNKLWNRTVIVHMDVSRLSVWYISWNVFLLAVFVKDSSDCLVSLLKSMKKLFQECTLAKKKKKGKIKKLETTLMVVKVQVIVSQLCLTLCHPMDCSLPGSSVHGILQARILEWDAISFSRASSWPRDQTPVSMLACRFFTICVTMDVPTSMIGSTFKVFVSSRSFFFFFGKGTEVKTARRNSSRLHDNEKLGFYQKFFHF